MMDRSCSSQQENMVAPCSYGGLFHSQTDSFSMLFSMPNHYHKSFDETEIYPLTSPSSASSSSSSSSVDCTLSLGTPSTRLSEGDEKRSRHDRRPNLSSLRWDLLQSKSTPYYAPQPHKSCRANNGSGNSINNRFANNDFLLARRCANCDTISTPLWRNGPKGPKSLCNACGIRYKKEERRATAANANSISATTSGAIMDSRYGYQNHSWVQTQKMPFFSPATEFGFVGDSDRDSDPGIPFLSWRLNVTDRPGLVHDFTR